MRQQERSTNRVGVVNSIHIKEGDEVREERIEFWHLRLSTFLGSSLIRAGRGDEVKGLI